MVDFSKNAPVRREKSELGLPFRRENNFGVEVRPDPGIHVERSLLRVRIMRHGESDGCIVLRRNGEDNGPTDPFQGPQDAGSLKKILQRTEDSREGDSV